uniref:Uncharacterized protein n=2 Tax=Fagus sylvatica TaxID=28930 RepID=A0A2N9F4W0_FAGSY
MMMCEISTVVQTMLSLMEDSDGRPETKENSDDGRKTPVGCRPKFLRCLCQRFGGEGLTSKITTLESSLRLFILVDDRFGRSFRRLFDDPGGDFDDVPSNVVVLFWTIIYGRHSRGAVTVAESGGRVLDLGDLVSPDSVLRRLSVELFDFVFPAIDTWGVVRGLMAAERGSWSSVHSEDLPEGLSDRGEDSHSTEDTPSVSGSSRAVGPDDSWIARSYLSKVVDVEGLDKLRSRYQIPEDVVLRIPQSDEVACSSRFGDVAFYEADFNAGVRFPMQPLMRELLDRLNLAPGQLAPNAWRTVVGSMVMWKVLSEGKDDLTLDELLFCYKPCQIPASPGFWSLNMRQRGLKLIVGTPSSNREWKDNYVFVCGDNWEGLQCEKDDNFIPVRREWGVPSSSALRRPKLDEKGHNRVLRSLHHTQHHYKHFIRPELLALYSFGPEPSEAVLSLQEINQKRMATARLNREKLKKMMMTQQEEAPLVIGKKRKADLSSKKATDERSLPPPPPPVQKPSVPEPVPTSSVEVVEISAEPSSSRPLEKVPTLPRDASLACRRAKSVVTKDDVGEYDKVNTDVVKVAGIHSLMKGLTELTVIANRCTQWEDALLKQKIQMSEAAQANQRLTTLVNELTLDRDRVVGELSILGTDLARRDEELKKALDGARRSDEQVKALTSQLEGARISAVEEFKSSEAYDDVNTKYFLSGFNLLKKQAKEKFPQLDFDAFQPFDDDESTMPAEEGNVEAPAHDPQMDDDATS